MKLNNATIEIDNITISLLYYVTIVNKYLATLYSLIFFLNQLKNYINMQVEFNSAKN